ncbi:RteC domain-containing protein [Chryseobacterium gallinarum]|uniref:RteC domain-containing protein n=1 Tax=Chryseobacterium gallinarum TaxID=1324352 RepID=UPI002024A3F9|nr:RteC domain-containing protein [Chryseobacterium gallinarum]MCL8537635.1 RteC domain-containing protein [Chryseobacterium gallinarum]
MTLHMYEDYLNRIKQEEQHLNLEKNPIEESCRMAIFLKEILEDLKEKILKDGFSSKEKEIEFFRHIKPVVLGKLIYYNKIYRIETLCPVSGGKMYKKYFLNAFQNLTKEYKTHISNSDFYRYYRSGRNDLDEIFFCLGQINIHNGLNSYVFEIDPKFSTYYDYKVARILAYELFHFYLTTKITPDDICLNLDGEDELFWTGTNNDLIEFIYALFASGCVSYRKGRMGIRRLSRIFQALFNVKLTDEHHAFHRMKYRSGTRTAFINRLAASLEEYMDKDL